MGALNRYRSITIKAPAKINLYLKVRNKRKDGYHNLCSLMQMVGLYDHLTFQEAPTGIRLYIENSPLSSGQDNLVVQAAETLQKELQRSQKGRRKGVKITLIKNIPVSAGMGGGSSDAAATLLGLNRLWSLHWSRKKLAKIGEGLGSDLPFFFHGPTAWVTERGEEVEKVNAVFNGWAVLVNPGMSVSTAEVFEDFSKTFVLTNKKSNISIKKLNIQKPAIEEVFLRPYNDLEKITLQKLPVLLAIKKRLKTLGGTGVLMSGSGPTLFGLFPEYAAAKKAAGVMKEQSSLQVWVTKVLKRVPF
ncbi:MAG: 4-(cytidine 5'-diphospho)-2-C-methyl-D-erythritol kinase [Nitrospira sp.]|nr:4-(cytidine 5'-diphospho)-2-C-methyl-D-erythritol kinase [Candidatus Manganitrophaceae bacterium]HIL35654.1 4-(cytidine 5'-diphospho)-2-C-methyl-D-erythritol kinase [Candidatus Manganitrophaceae bacterium]